MKKLITITIIILQTNLLFSQNLQINKIWGMSIKNETATTILEVDNNTFFVSSYRFNNSAIINKESIILKLDSNCNVILVQIYKYFKMDF